MIIDSAIEHDINISMYKLCHITERIRPYKKGLINIQNINGNTCFEWCLVRYLHPADHHHPAKNENVN